MKGESNVEFPGKPAVPRDENNDFTLGAESQRPARMGRNTLPLRKAKYPFRSLTASRLQSAYAGAGPASVSRPKRRPGVRRKEGG
jgi:hypothetical protein